MKFETRRRRRKSAILIVAISCSLFILIYAIKRLQLQLVTSSHQRRANQTTNHHKSASSLEDELRRASKSSAWKYYEPKTRFSERYLADLRAKSRHQVERDRGRKYLIQPEGNVIDCEQLEGPNWMTHSSQPVHPLGEASQKTLFIVINSRADNFERRQRLRKSWLNKSNLVAELCRSAKSNGRQSAPGAGSIRRIEWLFALGRLNNDAPSNDDDDDADLAIDSRIHEESRRCGDLLVLNLHESYRNMTSKHLAIFDWLLKERNQSSSEHYYQNLLLKCDDDAHLDLSQIISIYEIEANPNNSNANSDLLMCARFEEHSPVLRKFTHHKTTKWSVTRKEWPYDTFPSYCSGLAYLANLKLVEKLHLVAPLVDEGAQPTLWIDDVYVTGVLLAALELDDLKLVKLNPYFCYTKAQRLHRESLEPGVRCMAAEMAD
jgi:hypothetical protein